MSKTNLKLSASRIKKFLDCSWSYYCSYILKLPQESNSGSIRGNCVHAIFEFLLKEKHKWHYDSIVQTGSIYGSPAVLRLAKYYLKRDGLTEFDNKGENNLKLTDEMILLGLKTDFFCEGKKLEMGELEISIEDPAYRLVGYIDKIAKEEDGRYLSYDYKSSSRIGDHSLQALTYALWVKRVLRADSVVRFLYLRFPDQVTSDYSFSDEQLDGFEEYLKSLYSYLENLTEEEAKKNMAWDKGFPKKEDGFSKRLLCGFGKYPKHKNKEGKEYWVCGAKFPMDYFVRLDKDGKIVESSKDPIDKKNETDIIEFRHYNGCPCHQNYEQH